jgi:hypothetical protein
LWSRREVGRIQKAQITLFCEVCGMTSHIDKPDNDPLSSPTVAPSNDSARSRSIATRLTEAELSEVETAAADAGKKVAEWLRDAALAHARSGQEQTDPILLAEIMGMRSLMLNLFARASQGPLSSEDLRKMSAYSDSMKQQQAEELMSQRRGQNNSKATVKP